MKWLVAFLRVLWRFVAGFAGFVVIEIATIVGFTPLGGIIEVSAPIHIHVLATLVAIVSGLLGGAAGTLAGGGGSRIPVLVTAAIILVESTFIVLYRRGANPIWFEVGGAATLLGATLVGGLLVRRAILARRAPPASV